MAGASSVLRPPRHAPLRPREAVVAATRRLEFGACRCVSRCVRWGCMAVVAGLVLQGLRSCLVVLSLRA